MPSFTANQKRAIEAKGNVLVVAGAGTGKTRTLVERCLRLLLEQGTSLERILMVTFTEAAAAEMRQRIRVELTKRLEQERDEEKHQRLNEQVALLDTAAISTLHSFCLQLVREHFYELKIDPQISVLDERQTQPLIRQTLDSLLERHLSGGSPENLAVQELIRRQGRGSTDKISALIVQIHRYTQTLAQPARWLEKELAQLAEPSAALWQYWFLEALPDWCKLWQPVLEDARCTDKFPNGVPNVIACLDALAALSDHPTQRDAMDLIHCIIEADNPDLWPYGTKTTTRKRIEGFFKDAAFLNSLIGGDETNSPLAEDWSWVRQPMQTLLRLVQEFTVEFTRAKRELGGVDFADLEQLSLELLRSTSNGVAEHWQVKFDYVFVDEYQDINEAQDAILQAVSRSGPAANRFLVGDVKQSIYRFRLANPRIFGQYEQAWGRNEDNGQRIPLADNFRSREAILDFLNPLFTKLMRTTFGGVRYDQDAALSFGGRETRSTLSNTPVDSVPVTADQYGVAPRVEFHLIRNGPEESVNEGSEKDDDVADLGSTEREARLVATRLLQLKQSQHLVWDENAFRSVSWRDMVVLLRSPGSKVEAYAKEFGRLGVPLQAERGGFFNAIEVMDLVHLLQLLDNPLQDVPLLAVLRSPLVGMSVDELATIRARYRGGLLWTALQQFKAPTTAEPETLVAKATDFLASFEQWRELMRHTSLSHCLQVVLRETHYEALLLAEARGQERAANVRRLLDLARQYDPYQRQGLFRFLQFIAAQEEAETDTEPAPLPAEDAVQLMSIHKSKGLEFPVVVLADMGKPFNARSLSDDILFSEQYGLCPKVMPPDTAQHYPSLPYWLARQRELREMLGEELRLLYVATTRARDTLILTANASSKAAGESWGSSPVSALTDQQLLTSRSYLDWLRLWLRQVTKPEEWAGDVEGRNHLLRWKLHNADSVEQLANAVVMNPSPNTTASVVEDVAGRQRLHERMTWGYAFPAATKEAAKTSVTVLRRQQADEIDEEAQPLFQFQRAMAQAGPRIRNRPNSGLSGARIGNAHHTFLEHLPLEATVTEESLRAVGEQLAQDNVLSTEELASLDFAALTAFWQSEVGRSIHAKRDAVHRELPFTARLSEAELHRLGLQLGNEGLGESEFIVVQGVIDLAVIQEKEIWLIDFKTDHIQPDDMPERVKIYEPQLKLYGKALEGIYSRPVKKKWLHFLALKRSVAVK